MLKFFAAIVVGVLVALILFGLDAIQVHFGFIHHTLPDWLDVWWAAAVTFLVFAPEPDRA